MDIPDINVFLKYFFGVPDSMVELWQEAGRCSHGEGCGLVIIYCTGLSLNKCSDHNINNFPMTS